MSSGGRTTDPALNPLPEPLTPTSGVLDSRWRDRRAAVTSSTHDQRQERAIALTGAGQRVVAVPKTLAALNPVLPPLTARAPD